MSVFHFVCFSIFKFYLSVFQKFKYWKKPSLVFVFQTVPVCWFVIIVQLNRCFLTHVKVFYRQKKWEKQNKKVNKKKNSKNSTWYKVSDRIRELLRGAFYLNNHDIMVYYFLRNCLHQSSLITNCKIVFYINSKAIGSISSIFGYHCIHNNLF